MNKGHDSSSGDIINKEEKLKTNGQTEGYMFPKRFESLNNSLNGVFKQYFDTIPTVANNLSQSLELFGERFKKVMPDISLQLNRMQNLFTPLEQTINSIREQYTHLFVSMPPPMTDEDKERIHPKAIDRNGVPLVYLRLQRGDVLLLHVGVGIYLAAGGCVGCPAVAGNEILIASVVPVLVNSHGPTSLPPAT